MKKILLLSALMMALTISANAQLGDLLNKAAKKAGEKATKAATTAVKSRLGLGQGTSEVSGKGGVGNYTDVPSTSDEADQMPSIQELLSQMPEIPANAQLTDYKNAEANEMTLKMMTSPVTMFRTQVFTLSAQAMAVAYAGLDSNAVTNMATRYTGLTPAEIQAMENMSDEEQEAFMMAYYQSGRADEARQQAQARAEQYAERIASQVEQFEAVNDKVENLYKEARKQMKPIYEKYSKQLDNAEGKAYQRLMAEYYSKIVGIQRVAVEQAMQMRKSEQMPIAEQIEKINEGIRLTDPGAVLPNYMQIFATAYFAEIEHLFETPTYFDED